MNIFWRNVKYPKVFPLVRYEETWLVFTNEFSWITFRQGKKAKIVVDLLIKLLLNQKIKFSLESKEQTQCKILKFHQILWKRTTSVEFFAQNNAETVCFHKISTQGNRFWSNIFGVNDKTSIPILSKDN